MHGIHQNRLNDLKQVIFDIKRTNCSYRDTVCLKLDKLEKKIYRLKNQIKELKKELAHEQEVNKEITRDKNVYWDIIQYNRKDKERIQVLEWENEVLKSEIEEYTRSTHGKNVFIACEFDINHTDYITYKGYCQAHKKHTPTFAILKYKRFDEILTEQTILKAKQTKQDKREDGLRDLNKKIMNKLKEQNILHKNQMKKIKKDTAKKIKEYATLYNTTESRYNAFKTNFKNQIQTATETIKTNAEKLITTYEQHHESVKVLKEYGVVEQFINNVCYERTGRKRNYNAQPPIYNNIYTLQQLKGINTYIKDTFDMNTSDFVTLFLVLKAKRCGIAHPEVGKQANDIITVQQIIERGKNTNCWAG